VRQKHRALCVAVNPIKAYKARKDGQLRDTIKSADFCLCDGVGMAAAVRLLHRRVIPRITGIQLFFELISQAEAHGLKVFLLGAEPQSNDGAYEKLRERYPRLRVVGRHHGYSLESEAVIQQINESQADMLFVAMGSPRQEKWLAQYRDRIDASFCMGVGGSFDVLAGIAKRAPRVFQRTGTEWLYRLAVQPQRFRQQIVLPLFAMRLAWLFLAEGLARATGSHAGRQVKVQGSTGARTARCARNDDSRIRAVGRKAGANPALGQESWAGSHRQPSLTKS